MSKAELVHYLKELVQEFKDINGWSATEDNIQAHTTLPLLKFLGWINKRYIVNTPQDVKTGKKPDILLLSDFNSKLIVVESKVAPSKETLDGTYQDITFQQQLSNYCDAEGLFWGVLTNFVEWRVYSSYQQRLYKNRKYAFHDLLWRDANKSDYIDLLSDEGLSFFQHLSAGSLQLLNGRWDDDPVYYPEQEEIKQAFFDKLKSWRSILRSSIQKEYGQRYEMNEVDLITQKILDRLIFIDYCADNMILSQNRLNAILFSKKDKWLELSRIFSDMNDKFNTELFSSSPCDTLTISDGIIVPIIQELANINFKQLSVHIIGEVYENYLGEILAKSKSNKVHVDKKKESKTKKTQGIYYTPDYIVDYIVENTVGVLLSHCKTEDQISKIRVIDPACGSGSFLIRVFDTFKEHYSRVNRHQTSLFEFETRKAILQNNIFGVDIDPRAIEISKLNLMIKAVEGVSSQDIKGKKLLPSLELNIRCGNSLVSGNLTTDETDLLYSQTRESIQQLVALRQKYHNSKNDDEKSSILHKIKVNEEILNSEANSGLSKYFDNVDSVNPFNYPISFPDVFSSGGFDCVVGNPPWGGGIDEILPYLKVAFKNTTKEHTDTFKVFVDLNYRLLKTAGVASMIVPNTLLRQSRLHDVREIMLDNTIIDLVDLGEDVFKDVVAPSCIYGVRKTISLSNHKAFLSSIASIDRQKKHIALRNITNYAEKVLQSNFAKNPDFSFVPPNSKLNVATIPLGDFVYFELRDTGIQCQRKNVGKQERKKSDLAMRLFYQGNRRNKSDKMYWKGRDINRYFALLRTDRFCYVNVKKHLKKNEVVYFNEHVYNSKPKIILRQTADRFIGVVDYERRWFDGSVIGLVPTIESDYAIEYILAVLNSNYAKWVYHNLVQETGRVFAQVKLGKLKQIPIRKIDFNNISDSAIHNRLVELVKEIQNLSLIPVSDKSSLKFSALDKQIDNLVYSLYGLSSSEIETIEKMA